MRQIFDFAVMEMIRSAKALEAGVVMQEAFRRQSDRIEERKEKQEDVIDAADLIETMIVVGVTDAARIRRLGSRVDLHQQTIVELLLENQEKLERVREHIDEMLDEAYVLEDGRRVFKTRDGERIFDEHGVEVDMDADLVEDFRPRWETYRDARDHHQHLSEERQGLLDYQQRLDDAQARIDAGDLSDDDFEEIESLFMDAPTAVRARLPNSDPATLSVEAPRADVEQDGFSFGLSQTSKPAIFRPGVLN